MKSKKPETPNIEEQLIKYLTFLLNNKKCVIFLKTNKNFQKIIKTELLILNHFLSSKKKDKNQLHDLVDKYNGICLPNKLDLKDELTIKNEDEMVDYANYLKVYVKNILQFDIDAAIIDPKKFQDVKIEAKEPLGANDNRSEDWQTTFQDNYQNINPFVLREAQERIRKKLKNDEIFIYKSKPKIIKILKIVYCSLMLSFTFALFFLAIVWFMIANRPTGIVSASGQNILFGYWNPIFLIIFSFIFSYFGIINIYPYILAKRNKTKPSENGIYSVIPTYIGFASGFSVLFSIYMMWPVIGGGAKTIFQYISVYGAEYDDLTKVCVILMSVAIGLMLTLSLLLSITGIILIAKKPQQDENKIKKLLYDEINRVINEANSPTDKPIDLTPDKPTSTELKN